MPVNQAPITADDLNALEVICARLADVPDPAAALGALRPYVFDAAYHDLREGVIFYRSGSGWRLHALWREALAVKRATLDAQSDRR